MALLGNRVPATVNRNLGVTFPKYSANNTILFYTKQEFDFVANETSYQSLSTEASRYMATTTDQLENEVNIFRSSVNRAPETFRVPEDNGDRFFKKMNLGLYLVNRTQQKQYTHLTNMGDMKGKVNQVATWISNQIVGNDGFQFKDAAGNNDITVGNDALWNELITAAGDTETLFHDLITTQDIINNDNTQYPQGVPGYLTNIFNSAGVRARLQNVQNARWRTDFPVVGNTRPGLDLLVVFVSNMYPNFRKLTTNSTINPTMHGHVAPYGKNPIVFERGPDVNPNSSSIYYILFNIGKRLQEDAFYRENNFKQILEEIGMSVDDFARLVENSVSTIYWPDCVASKSSEEDIRYLVKGLGLDDPSLAGMNKVQLCSFILTSVGFKPEDFNNDNFNLLGKLGQENVANLKRIVSMLRRDTTNVPAGYLGFDTNLSTANPRAISEGAFLMTGYTAHNVTMDKATDWLRATNMPADTQVTFKQYSDNQNMFDLLAARQGTAKPIGAQMDFTRQGIENRMIPVAGANYQVLGRV